MTEKVRVSVPIRKQAKNGADGTNAIRLDLDNENDSMLYDGAGNLVSGKVTSQATLYDGATAVTSGVGYSIVCNGCTATIANGKVTVTAMSADTATVTVTATYNGKTYTAILSLKKLVGVDKYDIVLSANSVSVNVNKGNALSPKSIEVYVYKTAQNGTREKLQTLPNGYSLKNGKTAMDYTNSKATLTPSADDSSYTITLYDSDGKALDSETIPVVKDGSNGADGKTANPNLLDGTGFTRNLSAWNILHGTVVNNCMNDGFKCYWSTNNESGTSYINELQQFLWKNDGSVVKIKASTWYTLSFESACNEKYHFNSYIWYSGGGPIDTSVEGIKDGGLVWLGKDGAFSWDDSVSTSGDGNWRKHVLTFKTASNWDTKEINLLFRTPEGQSSWRICHIKLEEGTEATPWQLSEADRIGDKGDQGDKGEQGDKGDDGADAVTFYFDPSIINFNTNSDGSIYVPTGKTYTALPLVQIGDNEPQTADIVEINSCFNCNANTSNKSIVIPAVLIDSSSSNYGVKIAKTLEKVPYYDSNGIAQKRIVYIPYLSGYVDVDLSYTDSNGTKYSGTARLSFAVDFSTSYAEFYHDNSQFVSKIGSLESEVSSQGTTIEGHTSTITELSNKISSKVEQTTYDEKMTSIETQFSEIEQTADGISLKVNHISSDSRRFNLLSNAMFHLVIHKTYRVIGYATLVKGNKYTLTVNGYSPSYSYGYRLRVKIDTTSTYLDIKSTSATTSTMTFISTVSKEVYFKAYCTDEDGTETTSTNYYGVINWAVLEDGDKSSGEYLLSESDNYANANLLQGTRTATTGENGSGYAFSAPNPTTVTSANGSALYKLNIAKYMYYTLSSASDSGKDFLSFVRPVYASSESIYTFSFWAKASVSGKSVGFYVVEKDSDTADDVNCVNSFVTSTGGKSSGESMNGITGIALTTSWAQYWVTFRVSATGYLYLMPFRMYSAGTYYFAGAKLEKGGRATDYTDYEQIAANESEMGMLTTGIDITNRKILATADNFEIQNNSGKITFSVDSEGNIVASGDGEFQNIKATNGTFKGEVNATSGSIAGVNLSDKEVLTAGNNIIGSWGIGYVDDNSSGAFLRKGTRVSFSQNSSTGTGYVAVYDVTNSTTLPAVSISTSGNDTNIALATNGRMIARSFRSFVNPNMVCPFVVLRVYVSIVNSAATPTISYNYANDGTVSTKRTARGVVTITLSKSLPTGYTYFPLARADTSSDTETTYTIKAEVVSFSTSTSTSSIKVVTSNDSSTDDCNFELIVLAF